MNNNTKTNTTGTFYGIGTGAGDPELLTIKAVRLIEAADIIIVPRSEKKGVSRAYEICRPYIKDESRVVYQVFPMHYRDCCLNKAWQENKEQIEGYLQDGKDVVFLTLGDPMLYSTYLYIYKLLKDDHCKIVTVPGITSFSDIAARTGMPLALGNEILKIVPATIGDEELAEEITHPGNLVLMKVYRNFDYIIELLRDNNLLDRAVMISNCGMEDEKLYLDLTKVSKEQVNYLTTIIVNRGE